MAANVPQIRMQFFDSNGDPLSGGKLYSYTAGTSTPKATYTTSAANVPNTNPVILDSNGEADIWISTGSYKFTLTDANDVTQWTKDNIPSLAALYGDTTGALVRVNNLSDLTDAAEALENLGLTATSSEINGFDARITENESDILNLETDKADASALSTHISDTSTHGVTGDVVGTSDAQTLTNKTIDGDDNTITDLDPLSIKTDAANANKVFTFGALGIPQVQKLKASFLDAESATEGQVLTSQGDGTVEWGEASGGGNASFVKWIENPTALVDTSGWEAYADAASSTPVDGTGGLPDVSITRTTTPGEFYYGTSGFEFFKAAGNCQGHGWSTEFTLEEGFAESSRKINVTIPYKFSNTDALSGDIKLFIYDVDGSSVISVLNDQDGEFLASTSWTKFQGSFYTVAGHENYRLILHVAGTNADEFAMYGQISYFTDDTPVPGAIITPWQSYTPTFTGLGTVSSVDLEHRRVGTQLEIRGNFTTGTVSGVNAKFSLPSGLVIDGSTTATGAGTLLVNSTSNPSAKEFSALVFSPNTEVFFAPILDASTASPLTPTIGSSFLNSTKYSINGVLSIPISGWEASASLSTTELMMRGTNVTAMSLATASHTTSGAWLDVSWNETRDTLSDFNGTTFTAKNAKKIRISGKIAFENNSTAARGIRFVSSVKGNIPFVQSAPANGIQTHLPFSAEIDVVQNETIKIQAYQGAASPLAYVTAESYLSITEVFDPTVFSTYGQFEIKTATSSVKTPSATGNYNAMSGNSIPLPVGTWRLTGSADFGNNGSSPAYSTIDVSWRLANGGDSGAVPTALASNSNIQVLSAFNADSGFFLNGISTTTTARVPVESVVVKVTNPTTVYLVPRASMSTAGNARITVFANAERLQ